jgi:hypothetical protein
VKQDRLLNKKERGREEEKKKSGGYVLVRDKMKCEK